MSALVTRKEAMLRLYAAINCPVSATKKLVQYDRPVIEAALDVLRQLLAQEGVARPEIHRLLRIENEQQLCGSSES